MNTMKDEDRQRRAAILKEKMDNMVRRPEEIRLLRLMVKGSYDLQELRMQTGLRLCAQFRARLKVQQDEEAEDGEEGLNKEALNIISVLKDSYKRLTDGVARNRTLPAEKGFIGNEVISSYTELVLVDQYILLERQETRQFGQFMSLLEKIPVYNRYLNEVPGVGPTLAAVLISYLNPDPRVAQYPSSWWMYAGLDVGPDGAGRSRRTAHLVERDYIDKNGELKTRLSTTYNPWLKMKLLGTMGPSFLRTGSPWRKQFDDYKHRIMSDPARIKVSLDQWKKLNNAKDAKVEKNPALREQLEEEMRKYWAPGRIKNAALRHMVKQFLLELNRKWREIDGHPPSLTYQEAKLGHFHRGDERRQAVGGQP